MDPRAYLTAPLLRGDERDNPEIAASVAIAASADAVVIGSPVFKATYSGLLKVFVDILPMDIFAGIPALPIPVGGSPAPALALDFSDVLVRFDAELNALLHVESS